MSRSDTNGCIDGSGSAARGSDEGPGSLCLRECGICGYRWSGDAGIKPRVCPSCRTSLWDRESARRVLCRRCGHEWMTASNNPARCPACRSKMWALELVEVVCRSCGERWADPLKAGTDAVCPGCGRSGHGIVAVSKKQDRSGVSRPVELDASAIERMRLMGDRTSRVKYLVGLGVGPVEAEAIVRFDSGDRVVPISRELNVSLESVMDAVLPVMDACRGKVDPR